MQAKLSKVLNTFEILWKMKHLLQKSKCSIFHNIFTNMIFQRRQKELLWCKGLTDVDKPNFRVNHIHSFSLSTY